VKKLSHKQRGRIEIIRAGGLQLADILSGLAKGYGESDVRALAKCLRRDIKVALRVYLKGKR
jgi:hypothetical protein